MAGLLQETRAAGSPAGVFSPEAVEAVEETVQALCVLLDEHRAGEVTALDLRELHSWTDYFIIATVTSGAHRDGLLRHVKDFAGERGISMRGSGKTSSGTDDLWSLVDLGTVVVHLMSPSSRSFYELERLWSSAKTVYPKFAFKA
ncbi:MAG: ribosome silencing factor [Treponema sp.]|jgi:ribosome-associated protein|nr:ribosome silencing factor [Treponema sp.]